MNINVIPLKSVNEVDFGSDRETVRKKFGKYKEFKKSRSASNTTDDFGFCHAFYNSSDKLDAVEIFVSNGNAIKISSNTIPSTISKLKEVMPDLTERETGYFVSRAFSSGVYCDGDKIKSILFGKKNYYNKINSIVTRAFLIEKLNQISDILMESENSGSFDSRAKSVAKDISDFVTQKQEKTDKQISFPAASVKKLSSELIPETLKAIEKKGKHNVSTDKKAKAMAAKMRNMMKRVDSSRHYHMESGTEVPRTFLYIGGLFLCISAIAGIYLAPNIMSDIQEIWDKSMNRKESDYLDMKYIYERLANKMGVIVFPFIMGVFCIVIHYQRVREAEYKDLTDAQQKWMGGAMKIIDDSYKEIKDQLERDEIDKEAIELYMKRGYSEERAKEMIKYNPFRF